MRKAPLVVLFAIIKLIFTLVMVGVEVKVYALGEVAMADALREASAVPVLQRSFYCRLACYNTFCATCILVHDTCAHNTCSCHDSIPDDTFYNVYNVPFPAGVLRLY